MLVNKDFQTLASDWLAAGCQPIKWEVWKSLLTNTDFKSETSQKYSPKVSYNFSLEICIPTSDIYIYHCIGFFRACMINPSIIDKPNPGSPIPPPGKFSTSHDYAYGLQFVVISCG